MEALFEVYVVSKKREVILDGKRVVAPDEAGARFEAGVDEALRSRGLKPQNVTVVVRKLGDVAVEKEPEKVRIISDAPEAPAAQA